METFEEMLAALIESAARAQPNNLHGRPDGTYVSDHKMSSRAGGGIEVPTDALVRVTDVLKRAFPSAGQTATLNMAVAASAKTIRAGAQLLALPHGKPLPSGSGIAGLVHEVQKETVMQARPAEFSAVPDGETSPNQSFPSNLAVYDRESVKHLAARFVLSRRQRTQYGVDRVSQIATRSIVQGLGNAVDADVAALVFASSLPSYTGVSDARHSCSDLFAFVPDPTILTAGPDGRRYLGGVEAEWAPVGMPACLGVWSNIVCWLEPEIQVHCFRGPDDSLEVTCWIALQSAFIDASTFWGIA